METLGTAVERDRRDWRAIEAHLGSVDPDTLSGEELEALAEARFWLDRPAASTATWHRAHLAFAAVGDGERAAMAAWRAFYDHFLVGERAVAAGWLRRARQHAPADRDRPVAGYLAVADADVCGAEGRWQDATRHAERAVAIGRACGDRDLAALALNTHGRLLIEVGRVADGVALLDEVMVSVIAGEVTALFTGWVFCSVLDACHGLADLARATEWTDAALRWCETLQEGALYPGLCRVHRAELACLRGAWDDAEAQAALACDQIATHDARYAGEAVYLVGDLRRLRGDLDGAEVAYLRAHALGRSPHPGLALVRLQRGQVEEARRGLRNATRPGPTAALPRARLLAAVVDTELVAGDAAAAEVAMRGIEAVADHTGSTYLHALARESCGAIALERGDVTVATELLRVAHQQLAAAGLPFDAARAQVRLALALRRDGDQEGARLELAAARATFDRLGAAAQARHAAALLGAERNRARTLTAREVEVLRSVAAGRTNRQVGAELGISEHTVARHLSNIRAKLGVRSRAAAAAYAVGHELVTPARS